MRNDFLLFVVILISISSATNAQQHVFKVKADTASITNAELILENKTKDTLGFLYNKGNGRTEFRRALVPLDTSYLRRDINMNTNTISSKEPTIAPGTTSQYWRGDKTWQTFPAYEPLITGANAIKRYWNGYKQLVGLNTDSITEGSLNKYYTDARVRAAISVTGSATYDNSTGVINVTGGGAGWSLTGNSINPVNNFIGTSSNNSLRIRTNNTERLVIDSVGYFKIDGFNSATAPAFSIYTNNALRFSVGASSGTTSPWGFTVDNSTYLKNGALALGLDNPPNGSLGGGVISAKNLRASSYSIRLSNSSNILVDFAVGDSGVLINNSVSYVIRSLTGNFEMTMRDHTVLVDATGSPITATLPNASAVGAVTSNVKGRVYVIKKTDASANSVTIAAKLGQTIDGAATYVLAVRYKYVMIQGDGANWMIIGNN